MCDSCNVCWMRRLELQNVNKLKRCLLSEVKADLFYTFRPGFVDLVTVETILRNKVATGWNNNLSQKQAAWSISRLRLRSLQGISDKQNARSFHCRSHNDSFIRLHNFSTKFSSCFSFWICSMIYLQKQNKRLSKNQYNDNHNGKCCSLYPFVEYSEEIFSFIKLHTCIPKNELEIINWNVLKSIVLDVLACYS